MSITVDLFCRAPSHILYTTDWDLVFADDERDANPTSFKFLQMAQAWASAKKNGVGAGGSSLLSGLVSQASKFKKAERRDTDAMSDVASSHGGDEDD